MYTLVTRTQSRLTLMNETAALVVALIIAELFFKFHSFTLECAAFLATWTVLDWIGGRITPR